MASAQADEMTWLNKPKKSDEKAKAFSFDNQFGALMAASDETVGGQILHCEDAASIIDLVATQEACE